jgi:hypothetical protein
MGVHFQSGGMIPGTGKREEHPDELEYLRNEVAFLESERGELTKVRIALRAQLAKEQFLSAQGIRKDLEVRKLRYDNLHLWTRNYELMAKLSAAMATIREIEDRS